MTLSPIGPSRDKSKVPAVADPRDAGGLAGPDCPAVPLEGEEAILATSEQLAEPPPVALLPILCNCNPVSNKLQPRSYDTGPESVEL